ncbi:MAG: sigma-70 family RNA polymerase sigma factor [Bacteroidales bacterium]|nr:sigma-70 family RNA polymerase sigma factor [Bacteroidales bacterium]
MQKETHIIIRENPDMGLESFYLRYGKQLLAYSLKNWQTDEDTAWELIYKTYEKISKQIDKYNFKNEEKFASFVLVSFLNNLRNHYRDIKKQIEIVPEENIKLHPAFSDDDQEQTESAKLQLLNEELAKLEDWERMLLLLKAQQMPYSEIAKYIDKPENQLKVYYARLKRKITEKMTLKMEVNHE